MIARTTKPTQATDRLARFADHFMRCVKSGALYGPEHPQRIQLVRNAREVLRTLGDAAGSLSMAVTPSGLQVQGVIVDSEEANEIARRLAVGGLSFLELKEGITSEELGGLAELCALDLESLRMEDDLATLLWEKQWPNVGWEAVEVPSAPVQDDEPSTFNSSVPENTIADPLHAADWTPEQFLLSPEELGWLEETLAKEQSDPDPVDVASLLCQLIGVERTAEGYEQELQTLRSVVDLALRDGRFGAAHEILQMLLRFNLDPKFITDEKRRSIAECHQSFATDESIEAIMPLLEQGSWDSSDNVCTFLEGLPSRVASPLLEALPTFKNDDARVVVRTALATHLRRDLTLVQEQFERFEGDMLFEVVALLRSIGSKETIPLLTDAMHRGTVDLRLHVIETLKAIGGAHARSVLVRALSDPDVEVSSRAAEALPTLGAKEALEPLLKELLRSEFRERPFEQRLSFFRALGRTDLPEVLPFIRKMLMQKTWWRPARVRDDRVCAATALNEMSHPEATAMRGSLIESGPRAVREILTDLSTGGEA